MSYTYSLCCSRFSFTILVSVYFRISSYTRTQSTLYRRIRCASVCFLVLTMTSMAIYTYIYPRGKIICERVLYCNVLSGWIGIVWTRVYYYAVGETVRRAYYPRKRDSYEKKNACVTGVVEYRIRDIVCSSMEYL